VPIKKRKSNFHSMYGRGSGRYSNTIADIHTVPYVWCDVETIFNIRDETINSVVHSKQRTGSIGCSMREIERECVCAYRTSSYPVYSMNCVRGRSA